MLKIDATYAEELRALAPQRQQIRAAAVMVGHRYKYNEAIRTYGRVLIGWITACTMLKRQEEFEPSQIAWALSVCAETERLKVWTPIAVSQIHPALLADASRGLRKLTTEIEGEGTE